MDSIHVLYLEDDEALGALTVAVLKREGFEVTWAKNGEEGLSAFRKSSPQICIVDVMMPRLDGYSFVKTIRAADAAVPIIFLSARVLTEDVLQGFNAGADDYVRKPYSIEELLARMNRLLGKAAAGTASPTSVRIGDYEYRPATFELLHPSAGTVHLSPRAGELLFRMATAEGYLLPRRETLLSLWGDDSFFNGRSLDVFITKLRKQLSADVRIRIVNIRGQGYKLTVSRE